jgi:hypothetical protein
VSASDRFLVREYLKFHFKIPEQNVIASDVELMPKSELDNFEKTGKLNDYLNFEKNDYLIRNGKKFLNKNWEKEQFYKLSDIDLQDKVLKMQKLVYENTTNKKEKAMLEEYLKKVGIV